MNVTQRYNYLLPESIYHRKREQERHERKLKEIKESNSTSLYFSKEHMQGIRSHNWNHINRKQFNDKIKSDELHANNARILNRIIAISSQDVVLAQTNASQRIVHSPKRKFDDLNSRTIERIERENAQLSSRLIQTESELSNKQMAESFSIHMKNKKRIQKFQIIDEEKGLVKLKADDAAMVLSQRSSTRGRLTRKIIPTTFCTQQNDENEEDIHGDSALFAKSTGFGFNTTMFSKSNGGTSRTQEKDQTRDGYSPVVSIATTTTAQDFANKNRELKIKRAMTSDRWTARKQFIVPQPLLSTHYRDQSTARTTKTTSSTELFHVPPSPKYPHQINGNGRSSRTISPNGLVKAKQERPPFVIQTQLHAMISNNNLKYRSFTASREGSHSQQFPPSKTSRDISPRDISNSRGYFQKESSPSSKQNQYQPLWSISGLQNTNQFNFVNRSKSNSQNRQKKSSISPTRFESFDSADTAGLTGGASTSRSATNTASARNQKMPTVLASYSPPCSANVQTRKTRSSQRDSINNEIIQSGYRQQTKKQYSPLRDQNQQSEKVNNQILNGGSLQKGNNMIDKLQQSPNQQHSSRKGAQGSSLKKTKDVFLTSGGINDGEEQDYTFTDSEEGEHESIKVDEAAEKLFSANSRNFFKDKNKAAFLIQERDDEEDVNEFVE